jgi:hypothetical protein
VKRVLSSLALPAALWSASAWAQTAPLEQAAAPTVPTASGVTSEPAEVSARTRQTAPASEQARELGREGLSAFGKADFVAALDLFQRAEHLAHSPVFQLYAARCLVALDRVSDARALLGTISTETMAPSAPEAWRRAQADARVELVLLDPPVDTEAPGDIPQNVDLDGHVTREVNGTPRMPTWHPEPAPARNFWQRATPSERGSLVAFGASATGLVFAVVTGALALVESAKVKENCVGTSCRPEDLPRAQDAAQLANLATVGTTVFIAGAGTGVVLWLLPSGPAKGELSVGLRGPGLRLDARF